MKLSELPDELKIYDIKLSNQQEYIVNGSVKQRILQSKSNFVELENGEGFNKAFIVSWKVNMQETRENVLINKDKLAVISEE